jgi:hypothetical protein
VEPVEAFVVQLLEAAGGGWRASAPQQLAFRVEPGEMLEEHHARR